MKIKYLVLFTTIVLLIGCSSETPTGNVIQENTITLGAIQPLTGKTSYVGQWVQEGIDLALQDLHAQGKDVSVIYDDEACDPKKAVSAFEKLTSYDDVDLIIGPTCSSSVLAVAPIANQDQKILFSTVATSSDITSAGDYIFRNRESGTLHGQVMAEYAYKKLNLRRVSIIYLNLDNGVTFKDSFATRFEQLGGKILGEESFEHGATDFRSQLTKLAAKNPDALYFAGQRMESAVKQAREMGLLQEILGPSTMENEELFAVAGKAADGVTYTYPPAPVDQGYQQKYLSTYGKQSEAYAANSYDAVMLLVMLHEKCRGDVSCIKDRLYKTTYHGVSGTFSFDQNGDVKKELLIKKVENNNFVVVSE